MKCAFPMHAKFNFFCSAYGHYSEVVLLSEVNQYLWGGGGGFSEFAGERLFARQKGRCHDLVINLAKIMSIHCTTESNFSTRILSKCAS
jgi:hypothetical protein